MYKGIEFIPIRRGQCRVARVEKWNVSWKAVAIKRLIRFIILLPALILAHVSIAQSDQDYTFSGNPMYNDYIFRKNIKSIQLHQTSWKFSPPIIQLGGGQQLQLDFDDLNGDYKDYYYTFIHCDANWKPSSDITRYDYISGYQQDYITNYAYSFNTYQKFTHYRLVFPRNSMNITLSGNYILKVYLENDPDSVAFTRRFMVYENDVDIHGWEKQAMGQDMYTKQEIQFTVNTSRYQIADPTDAFKTVILQDGRWDNAITNLQPQYVSDTSLQYLQEDDGNTFDGGNQFRHFDMTSLQYNGDNIAAQLRDSLFEDIQLKNDDPRPAAPYSDDPDINGQFLILTKDADSTPVNADYVLVHFFVPLDSAFTTGNLYIFGLLSDWQCKKSFRMHYDSTAGGYEAVLFLKQGYYDYEYAFLPKHSKVADVTVIEGDHYETKTRYYILAYNREVGLTYDKLVGFATIQAPGN